MTAATCVCGDPVPEVRHWRGDVALCPTCFSDRTAAQLDAALEKLPLTTGAYGSRRCPGCERPFAGSIGTVTDQPAMEAYTRKGSVSMGESRLVRRRWHAACLREWRRHEAASKARAEADRLATLREIAQAAGMDVMPAQDVRVGDEVHEPGGSFVVYHAMTTGKKARTTSLKAGPSVDPRHYTADAPLVVRRNHKED